MTPEQQARALLPPANETAMHYCELWLDGQYYQFINQDGAWMEGVPEFDIELEAMRHPKMIDDLRLSGFLDMERGHYVPIYLRPNSDVTAIGGVPIMANAGTHIDSKSVPKCRRSRAAKLPITDIQKRAKRGEPIAAIARSLGVSRPTIYKCLKV